MHCSVIDDLHKFLQPVFSGDFVRAGSQGCVDRSRPIPNLV